MDSQPSINDAAKHSSDKFENMAKEKLLTGQSSEGTEADNNGDGHPKFISDSQISTINDFTRHTRCQRWSIAMTVVAYFALAGFLIYDGTVAAGHLNIFDEIVEVQGFRITYAWLLLLPPINFLLVYAITRYILYCILYPY